MHHRHMYGRCCFQGAWLALDMHVFYREISVVLAAMLLSFMTFVSGRRLQSACLLAY